MKLKLHRFKYIFKLTYQPMSSEHFKKMYLLLTETLRLN